MDMEEQTELAHYILKDWTMRFAMAIQSGLSFGPLPRTRKFHIVIQREGERLSRHRNGKTPGITLPSAAGQEAVIRKAYQKANLKMENTTYVECHGTGTPVGDVIEVEALSRVFTRATEQPLLIGSVGHLLRAGRSAVGLYIPILLCEL